MNSNIINIARDYKKKEQRVKNAKAVAPVTDLCNKKKIKFEVNIDEGITIGDVFFNFQQMKEAMKFIKELDEPSLDIMEVK